MSVNNLVHSNECGLPLNAIRWLEAHHKSKAQERRQMIRDLHLRSGSFVVDAGCGPGLWIPLLAHAIGPRGQIVGVDVSTESLVTAQRRSQGTCYAPQVQYKYATLQQLPIPLGAADVIFSANVSQYLPDPVETFAAMGRFLAPGGRLIIKDIDFGTMRFHTIDERLHRRVVSARQQWEAMRTEHGYAFEDSWVGSKLTDYFARAGYEEVQEKRYRIVRNAPLSAESRFYLQGIAEWFVCEGAPLLSDADVGRWLQHFLSHVENILDSETFSWEETEYVVCGEWQQTPGPNIRYFDMHAIYHM